jgi:hypothetical protein
MLVTCVSTEMRLLFVKRCRIFYMILKYITFYERQKYAKLIERDVSIYAHIVI